MKVIKRDGRAVDYDREKIRVAIDKANQEVKPRERATKEEIREIIKYIEELGKKRRDYLSDRKKWCGKKYYIKKHYGSGENTHRKDSSGRSGHHSYENL